MMRAPDPPLLPTRLQSSRVILRAPVASDAARIFAAYAQDVEVVRWMKWRTHASIATTVAFVAQCVDDFAAGTRLPYVLALAEEPQTPIGMLEARPHQHRIELGYVLARPCWGRGLMPEAVATLTAAALDHPAVFRVQAFCDIDNVKSQRTLEKAGFAREGRHERFIVHPNISAEPRACTMYAKCR